MGKPVLVLLYGALGAAKQLAPLQQLLSQQYEVSVYEFPGHGQRAAEQTDFSIEQLAAGFYEWLGKKYTQPVQVFGYSMGGYVCLYLAKDHPQLFSKILTLGTKFSWSIEVAAKETSKLNAAFLLEKAPAYCDYLQDLHGADQWQNVLQKTAGLMQKLGEQPLLTADTLKQVQVPVHLLLGELDKMVTREETETVHQQIKGSRYEIVNGFVHPLERLDPSQLSEVLQAKFH